MEETLAAGAASTTATEMDMSWDNIMEGIASEYGGYTILAVMSGIYMKALMNTMYPVSGDQATIRSKSPYVYMALYILGVYGFSMSWIFKESDFDPALTLAIFKLGPGFLVTVSAVALYLAVFLFTEFGLLSDDMVERGGKLFVFLAGYLWVASYMREGEDLENMNWFIANLNMACNVGALTACGATLPRRASIWMMLGMGCNMMWQALAAGRNPFRTLDIPHEWAPWFGVAALVFFWAGSGAVISF